tara:strand:- start:15289 stop:15549 length:261 start_codon:yes stop_codon:yes gene_type:complete
MGYIVSRVLQALKLVVRILPYAAKAEDATKVAKIISGHMEEIAKEIIMFRKPESHGGKEITAKEYDELLENIMNRLGLIGMEMIRK